MRSAAASRSGFIGVKLYNEYRCTDPVVFPVIELAIHWECRSSITPGTVITSCPNSPTSPTEAAWPNSPGLSRGDVICATSAAAATGNGRSRRCGTPDVSLDLSGSVTDDGVVEMAARVLGPERLLFACDMSMTASVGRLRGG